MKPDWHETAFFISVKVLKFINANKISQPRLAKMLKTSLCQTNRIIQGKSNLTISTIQRIESVIGEKIIH